jgi:2-methylaconitate cis-trans-isomerase PrpF
MNDCASPSLPSPLRIPCVLMRGGTSRGPFFLARDLPEAAPLRDQVLIAAMGSPHALQVDGIGGGNSLTSKVAIISPSARADADVDYLFAQVSVERAAVDTGPNCGNMLCAVAPFAIEAGLVAAKPGETLVRIFNRNTGGRIDAVVQTPGGTVTYEGDTRIDGVPGTAAPIRLTFLDAEGSKTGALLPTGHAREEIDGLPVSLVDYATPMVLLRAADFGLMGDETPEQIDANATLLRRIETIRREAGQRMGLGDVAGRVIPKVGLLSPPRQGGTLTSRYLVPDRCHKSHAVTGALCVATASRITGSIAAELAAPGSDSAVRIEHPSGQIAVALTLHPDGSVARASLVRTARRIFEGNLLLPAHLFENKTAG